MTRYILSVDEFNRWRVFDTQQALGEFDTWADADKFRLSLGDKATEETAPAWAPKSGGY